MAVELLSVLVSYGDAFVCINGAPHLTPLMIVEGTALCYHLYLKVIYVELFQTHEGTKNDMSSSEADTLELGPNGNLEGGIKCFILESSRVLLRQSCDATI